MLACRLSEPLDGLIAVYRGHTGRRSLGSQPSGANFNNNELKCLYCNLGDYHDAGLQSRHPKGGFHIQELDDTHCYARRSLGLVLNIYIKH